MRDWKVWTVAAAAIVWSTASIAATPGDSVRVRVRVYRTAEDEQWLTTALAHTQALLARVSVRVEWVVCGGETRQPLECRVPLAHGELAVRLTREPIADLASAVVALGDSLIDRRANAGTLATIYVNRVVCLAERAQTTVATLAGRAIAHELGHLLMATSRHDATGLMRAHWTVSELTRDDPRDWIFSAGDAKAIRNRISRSLASLDQAQLAQTIAASSSG